jgi:uncharacterized DUF497 family protein
LEFEWDEAKRAANIEKHGFDFARVGRLFDAPHILTPARPAQAEQRWLAIGLMEGRLATAVFTRRNGRTRIISIRSARDDERRRYQAIYVR